NMETGLCKNKDGSKIPEHWITDVTAESGGKTVFAAAFNTSISKDPRPSSKTPRQPCGSGCKVAR
ncbi:MAG: thiosulfate oxidation carrier complex protein SoxZ, partial [Verrucomicrobia bacterium]|nr:thiosulfate oxidation carrier complex protein SoxZ [Verrucomicrobiota bacterium]